MRNVLTDLRLAN